MIFLKNGLFGGTQVSFGVPGSKIGSWSPSESYVPNDMVNWQGIQYKSLTNNFNSQPDLNPADWEIYPQSDIVGYDNSVSGMIATVVQDAIDELDSRIDLLEGNGAFTTYIDPAINAITAADIDSFRGGVITLTAAGNSQTLPTPTDPAIYEEFTIINNDTSTDSIDITGSSTVTLLPGEKVKFIWDSTAWIASEAEGVWVDDGTDIFAQSSTRNINLQAGGLKDDNVTSAITLGDAGNTALNADFSAISLIGSLNELKMNATNQYYISSGGDNTTDGQTRSTAVQDFSTALGLASAGDTVYCEDGSSFDEDITGVADVNIYAPKATLSMTSNKNLTMEAGVYVFDTIEGDNDNSLVLNNATSGYGLLVANNVHLLAGGSGVAVRNQVGRLLDVKVKQFAIIGSGDGIGDFTGVASHTHIEIDDFYLHSTGDAISVANGGEVVGAVQHCQYVAGGSGNFVNVTNGTVNLKCNLIESNINIGSSGAANLTIEKMTGDITVAAGGTLYIWCPEFTGTLTNSGTVFGQLGDKFYGVNNFQDFPLTPSSAPTSDYEAANKKYVDDEIVSALAAFATDTTLTGNGTVGTPLGIDLTNSNTWTGLQRFGGSLDIIKDGSTANLKFFDGLTQTGRVQYTSSDNELNFRNLLGGNDLTLSDSGAVELRSNSGQSITLNSINSIFLTCTGAGKVESNTSIDIPTGEEYQIDGDSINTPGTLSNVIYNATDQTINGVKTFGSFPLTPSSAPITDYEVANKKYVDDEISGVLAAVSIDATLTGDGTSADPLGINLNNSNTWTAVQDISVDLGTIARFTMENINSGSAARSGIRAVSDAAEAVFESYSSGHSTSANEVVFRAITDTKFLIWNSGIAGTFGDMVFQNNTGKMTLSDTGVDGLLSLDSNFYQSINSITALVVEQDGVNDDVFVVDTSTPKVSVNAAVDMKAGQIDLLKDTNDNDLTIYYDATNYGYFFDKDRVQHNWNYGALFRFEDVSSGSYVQTASDTFDVDMSGGGAGRLWFTGETIFNRGGGNYDFYIFDDSGSTDFFYDASLNKYSLGMTAQYTDSKLSILGDGASNAFQLTMGTNTTTTATQFSRIGTRHYNSAEEPLLMMHGYSASGDSFVRIGGGNSGGNAATQIGFYTAANTTTVSGTNRGVINSDGKWAIGNEINPDAQLTIQQGDDDGNLLTGKSTDISQPTTSEEESDTYFAFKKRNSSYGGLWIKGLTEASSEEAITIHGIAGDTTPTTPIVNFVASKNNGSTSRTNLGNSEPMIGFKNNFSLRSYMTGVGNLIFNSGTVIPKLNTTSNSSLTLYNADGVGTIISTYAGTLTINSFNNGIDGQTLKVVRVAGSGATSFTHEYASGGEPIRTPNKASFSDASDYGVYEFVHYNGYWYLQ